jgi:hypothetical protein
VVGGNENRRCSDLRLIDQLVLGSTNAYLYARNPRAVRRFYRRMGRLPNLAAPGSYLERMYWRKLVDRNPLFVELTDKLRAKEYCRRMSPELALPATLWIGSDADAIPDQVLAGDVFIKTNHGFNFNYRVRDGKVDRSHLKRTTDGWMAQVHGQRSEQWAYGQIAPKLLVEEAVGDAESDMLEFSISSSDGRAIRGAVIGHNKLPNTWVVALDTEGRPTTHANDPPGTPPKPLPEGLVIGEPFALAVAHARKLSVGLDHARVDFMWNGTTLYGSEITIYPAAGLAPIVNPDVEAQVLLGWELEKSHFLRAARSGPVALYAAALRRHLEAERARLLGRIEALAPEDLSPATDPATG